MRMRQTTPSWTYARARRAACAAAAVVLAGLPLAAAARTAAAAAVLTFADQPDVEGTGPMPRPYYDDATAPAGWPAGARADFTGFGLTEVIGYDGDGSGDTKSLFGAADFGSGGAAEIAFSAPVRVPRFYVYNLNGESEPFDGSFRVEGRLAAAGPEPVFAYAYDDGFRADFISFDVSTHPLLDRAIDRLSFFQFDSMNLDSVTVADVPEPGLSQFLFGVAVALGCRRGRVRTSQR